MALPRQLTIQVKKRQLKDIYGNNIIFTGVNPMSLTASPGSEDPAWHDFTEFAQGLESIELEFTAEVTDFGVVEVGNFAPKKGVSGTIAFEGDAHQFLKAHLVENVAAANNEVEVQITDTSCGRYIGYVIKASQLSWCEFNSLCVFDFNLKQIEDYTKCIEKTLITDNWQGWFQDEPEGGKKHPRFSYCIEQRPNWILVILWYLTSFVAFVWTLIYTVFYPILFIVYTLTLVVDAIITVINLIIDAVNTLPGVSIPYIDPISASPPATPVAVLDAWTIIMMETAGCGREHPAPLIRDYIANVCEKCGVQVDAATADIFFAPYLKLTHSDATLHNDPNPYYNACYLFPQIKRGVRRFRSINLLGYSLPDTTTYFQPTNAPLLSLDMFLNELNKVYNTQWRVIEDATGTPYLYIKRKDWFVNEPPLYDFSIGGADRSKLVEGICYEPQDFTVPAACLPLYEDDPADKCGVEAEGFYNGKAISFGSTIKNPLFNGVMDKKSGYAAAHFNCDGATTNYLYDALQWVYSLGTLNPIVLLIGSQLGSKIEEFANYALLLQSETISLPKILIWDGDTDNPGAPNFLNARAVRDKINIAGGVFTVGHTGWSGTVPGIDVPQINTLYPSQLPATGPSGSGTSTVPFPLPWAFNHIPQVDVLGNIFSATIPPGMYAVVNPLGSIVNPAPAILVNWPMYYEPHYLGTLWDKLHWIDDPFKNPRLHKTWRLKIPLCCEDLEKLNLVNTSNGQKLLSSVALDTTFYNKGVITSITVGYDVGDENGTGQYIQLKGIV